MRALFLVKHGFLKFSYYARDKKIQWFYDVSDTFLDNHDRNKAAV